jgi:predicted alpha-1,2-mannosidase
MNASNPFVFGGVWGPAATTLEYAFADWSLARLRAQVGDTQRATELDQRARGYRTLFDASTGTLRPRMADGSFLTPYDPDAFATNDLSGAGGPGFVEGTGWQYAFMVPHDLDGLIALHGGPLAFAQRLDEFFGHGRFTLFNEPDMAYPYLFTYVPGRAYETQREVRRLLHDSFGDGPGGLQGNDDAGTMSAWYVFSALGFYPMTPGTPSYRIGSPLFERVTLHLQSPQGAPVTFVIEAPGNSQEAVYVQSMTLNGAPLETPVLSHSAIVAGGLLRLNMGSSPAGL